MRVSAFLLCILTTRTNLRRSCRQDRPAAFVAGDDGLAEHASDHGAAATAATGAAADSGELAYLFESLGAPLNGFEHGAFADFIAQASGL